MASPTGDVGNLPSLRELLFQEVCEHLEPSIVSHFGYFPLSNTAGGMLDI